MVPPAPGLFSTTTWVPSAVDSLGARMREIVSAAPPGGKVAMSLMGALVGQPGLALTPPASEEVRVAAEAARTVRRLSFMRRSCLTRLGWRFMTEVLQRLCQTVGPWDDSALDLT